MRSLSWLEARPQDGSHRNPHRKRFAQRQHLHSEKHGRRAKHRRSFRLLDHSCLSAYRKMVKIGQQSCVPDGNFSGIIFVRLHKDLLTPRRLRSNSKPKRPSDHKRHQTHHKRKRNHKQARLRRQPNHPLQGHHSYLHRLATRHVVGLFQRISNVIQPQIHISSLHITFHMDNKNTTNEMDLQRLAENKKIMKQLNGDCKGFIDVEVIVMSAKVIKVNHVNKRQERVLAVTNRHIINIASPSSFLSNRIKRFIPLTKVTGMTVSRFGNELVIHV